MTRPRHIFPVLLVLSLLLSALPARGGEEIENLVDIFESDRKLIALIEGRRQASIDLRRQEQVTWSGSRGELGAFLTDERLLVVSTLSSSWQESRLRRGEAHSGTALISPYLVLVVTPERAIGFDAASGKFSEARLSIHDEVHTVKVENYIALVITSGRAFGLSAKASGFSTIDFRRQEAINAVQTSASKAVIRTTDRILAFEASGSGWREHRLN